MEYKSYFEKIFMKEILLAFVKKKWPPSHILLIILNINYLMKTIKILLVGLFFLNFSNLSHTQNFSNQTFLSGYYGSGLSESYYDNNVYIKRGDKGLTFSEPVECYYDLAFSQSSTYCDEDGKPLLQWQGCYLLDCKTLSPIYNGEFNYGPATVESEFLPEPFCSHEKFQNDPGPGAETGYFLPWSTFILDRGDPNNLLLVYYRFENLPGFDTAYVYLAGIDMDGSPNGGPAVTFKDSLAAKEINIKFGSISAVRHANGKDWYIAFSEVHTNNWYSILFDDGGIHEPIKSEIPNLDPDSIIEGWSVFSPDGSKYVIHHFNGFVVLDFDRCTGTYEFLHKGQIPDYPEIDIFRFSEFSPNNRFLYVSNALQIFQYDLDDPNFEESVTMVADYDTSIYSGIPGVYGPFSAPFRGYDGMLYYWSANTVKKLSRMEKPNQKGPDVGWTQFYYDLPFYPPWFPPTLIDYTTPPLPEPCMLSTNQIQNIQINFHPNPTHDLIKAEFLDQYNYLSCKIIDVNGREVWKGMSNDLKDGIKVGAYSNGIYQVLFDGKYVGRFVKL